MRLFDETFKGYYFLFGLGKKRKSSQRVLLKLLTHYLQDIGSGSHCIMDNINNELSANNMPQSQCMPLFEFLSLNEYDSDGICDDLMDYEQSDIGSYTTSNIAKCLNELSLSSDSCIKTLKFWTSKIPQYINELLHHLIKSRAQKQRVFFVAKSDFCLLSNPLQSILLQEEKDGAKSALFGDNENKICFLEEYIWSMDQDQFEELKALNKGGYVESELYSYYSSDITFKQTIFRSHASSPQLTGLGIELISYPKDKQIMCYFSFAVDELKWCLNGCRNILHQNKPKVNLYAFGNSLLNSVSSVTIRTSVRFRIRK